MALSSSFRRSFHFSSLGPAWMVSRGMLFEASSMELIIVDNIIRANWTKDHSGEICLRKSGKEGGLE